MTHRAIDEIAQQIRHGGCSHCNRQQPVDVHESHWAWSILVMTTWSSTTYIACKSCGLKKQFADLLFTLFLGPWSYIGFILAPVQIVRTIISMCTNGGKDGPSNKLMSIAENMVIQQRYEQGSFQHSPHVPDPDKPWRR